MRQTNTGPLVSVIIIFLNAEPFIAEAVESVFTQSYQAWELWLVDDGSIDGSTATARRYAEQNPDQVRLLEHKGRENRGMSASRNLGIQHSGGQYIAFLDADDAWFPNTLQEQVEILEGCPEAAMVYGPLQWWYSWTGKPHDTGRDDIESLGVPSDRLIRPPKLLPLFLQNKAAVPSGILVRCKAIDQFGAFENAFKGEYEDQVFCAKICLHAPVFASSRSWYRYRQHPKGSVSIGHATGQTLALRRVFLDWLANYLTQQGFKDRSVWWALRQEYWRYSHPRLFHFLRRNRHNLQQFSGLFGGGIGM